jgi:hypothetical protein
MWLAVALVLGGALPAWAEIDGFEVRSITAVADVSLSNRLGTTSSATEHLINIADCESYVGGQVRVEFGVDTTNYLNYKYGVAIALPGKTCNTDGVDFAGSDDTVCTVIASSGDLVPTFDEIVDLDRLSGGDCTSGSQASSVLYLVISDDSSANAATEEVLFNVDLLRPATPALREVVGGDQRIEVLFDDEGNETEEGLLYTVFWSTETIDDPPASTVSSDTTSSTSFDIDDGSLVNGESYYVRVQAIDSADNESGLSDELSAEPVPTTDFWEAYKAAGGTDPGGFCFIATAAYGSPMAPDLTVLRAFRDQVLWQTALGRGFVRGYYDWGRAAARWIADRPAARATARVALAPLVWLATLTTKLGPLMALILLSLAFALGAWAVRWCRRRLVELVEVNR